MSKKYKQSKPINYVHKGYVLYDSNLLSDKFINSLCEIIKLHDIFNIAIENGKTTTTNDKYTFKEINCLDRIELKDIVKKFNELPLSQIAEFKLIYFHGNLRGFYFRFNGFLFEQRSVVRVLESIEKHYFDDNLRQKKTSYINWLQENPKSFAIASKSGQYQSKTKLLSLDENLSKRIREYIRLKDMTMFQFMTGLIGIYYKVSKHKDLVFMTEYFDNNNLELVGDLSPITSYSLKKNPNILCHEFIKNDWVQLEKYSHIKINMKDKYEKLKGHVTNLPSNDMPFEMDFLIDEKSLTIVIEITFQKYKTKKDELFLMLNKIRMIIFDVLENDTQVTDLSLLTKKEEQVVLKYIDVPITNDYVGIYDQFKTLVRSNGKLTAISDEKEITFEQLDFVVEKIKMSFSKVDLSGKTIDLSLLSDIDQIAAFIVMDSVKAVYSDKCSYQLKKGILGYKLNKVYDGQMINGQYFINNVIISREGYTNYCQFMKDYFNLSSSDVVSNDALLKFGIPTLLSGGQIKINASKDEVSITELDSKELSDYPKMRHVITNDKSINNTYNYNLHYGLSFKYTVPYSFVGPITNRKVENLTPVNGLGFVILNKNYNLSQAFEKGDLYLFGPSVTTKYDYEFIDINGSKIRNVVKSGERATWFLDESLRL